MSIDLQTARTIIGEARAAASSQGFKPLTVVVLDAGGHLVAAEREDGSARGVPTLSGALATSSANHIGES